jgi:anti-sigma B factor antagonist
MDTEMPPDFAVGAEPMGDAYVVAPVGELDLGTVGAVRSALAARPPGCHRLVLDLSALTFFDTSGMRLVVETLQDARQRGTELAIVRGPEDVQRLFALAGMDDRLPFVDDREEALAQR